MAQKFLTNVELDAGLVDGSNSTGTSGYVLSSTGTATSWVDPGTLTAEAAEVVQVPVKNLQGSALTKGDPVYISGSVGTSGRLEVKLADAGNDAKMPAVGLLAQDLAINGEGYAVVTGKLRNLITSPINGITTSGGEVLYVKSGGTTGSALTTVKPTGVNFIQNVGKVGRASTSNNGTLVVSSILRANDVPTPLYIDHDNQRVGIDEQTPAEKLVVSETRTGSTASDLYTTVVKSVQSAGASPNPGTGGLKVQYNDGANDHAFGLVAGTTSSDFLTTGPMHFYTNSDLDTVSATGFAMVLDTSQRLGIGTTNPATKLHIDASTGDFLKISESGADRLTLDSNGEMVLTPPSNWGGYLKVGKDVGPYEVAIELGEGRTGNNYSRIDFIGDTTYTDYGFRIIRGNGGANTTSQLVHRGTGNFELVSQDSGDIILNPNSGNVGIKETNPDELLHITGDAPTIKLEDNVGTNYYNPKIEFFGNLKGGTLEYISNPGFNGMRLHYRNTSLNQDTFLELKGGQAAFNSSNITGGTNVSMTGELQVLGGDTSYFSAGNLAIGATTASERLVVSGNANITSNLYVGYSNSLTSCTYPAAQSLIVGRNNSLGGVDGAIIGYNNSIACTQEPWLNLGGNFIAGLTNEINGGYSHANAVFGQLNDVGTASINVSNVLVGGSQHEVTSANALLFGQQCRAFNANYSLTGGFDSNNFGGFGSVAIGAGATASTGNNQYAFGTGVTTPTTASAAYGSDQFVVGKFNEYTNGSSVPHRFAVGNGQSDFARDTPFCVIGGGTYTNGQVSINDADGFAYTSAPYSIFHVNGRATSSYSSTFTLTSDERLKKNITDYSKGLAEIIQVQPKSYTFNGKANTIEGVESIGVLAQEIKDVFPETVGTVNKKLNPEDEQETELYTVDISPVTYALINAVKELNAKVEALEARIQTLEGN